MIPSLTAVQFTRFMTSGRTSPALCGCEDETGQFVGEYVVKLRGGVQRRGLVNELIGSLLATHFELPSPSPALILLEPEMANLIASTDASKAEMVKESIGLNFGTQALTGYSTWPVDRHIPEAMWESAVGIFAFDALLQNPDRGYGNPNLLAGGDTIMIIDHEFAFSFLLAVLPPSNPWNLDRQGYLTDHVFFRRLKSHKIDLMKFTSKLSALSEVLLEEIFADLPREWNNEGGPRISQHLLAVRNHAEEFAEQIRRFLA